MRPEKSTPRTTVAVTGVAATDNPGPGIGVARCLRDALGQDVRLVALAYDAAECLALAGEVFDHVFLLPYPGQGGERFLTRLREVHALVPIDVLMPCLDVELPLLQAHDASLAEEGIHCVLPVPASYRMRDKEHLESMAALLKLSYPKTRVVGCPSDLGPAAAALSYPLFVKGHASGAVQVDTPIDLQRELDQTLARWGYPVMLQETVPGTDLLLAGLGDGIGGLIGSVSLRKEHQTSQGKLWNALTVHAPWLNQAAQLFLAATQWKGPFELECRLGQDGQPYLIEINPRFPAWIHAGAQLGMNLPAALLADLLGDSHRLPDMVPAGRWVVRSIRETVLDSDPFETLATEGAYCHAENL